jgi:predicted alpha-1,2-mannosidase
MENVEIRATGDRTRLEGCFTMSATQRRPKPFKAWFVISFPRPFEAIGDWSAGRATVSFGHLREPLLMKAAISYTSLDGARANLAAELPHWDFDRVRRESEDTWNAWLSRITVEGGTPEARTKFYTDTWRALLGRRIVSDVDDRYADNTGPKTVVRQGSRPHHNFDALWGAQWSLNVLWPLAWPEVMDDFADTMLAMYANGGLIPRGPSGGNYSYVMIGDPAAAFFAAAWNKGIRHWDAEAAYVGLRKNAFPGGIRDRAGYEHRPNPNGGGMTYYTTRGYVPEDIPESEGMHRQGAAMTLEYAYQDWCLAQLAKSLGKDGDHLLFMERSRNYRHLWDASMDWMRPRRLDGSWYEPFAPVSEGFAAKGFVESTSAVYTFHVPHDIPGLARLFGGADRMAARLEENFRLAAPARFVTEHAVHGVAWIDYGNQPGTAAAHIFSHLGKPWLSQQWVRQVHKSAFSDTSPFGGYNGDEDQGQMGALSALMAIGLFDMSGGAAVKPAFDLTAPLFDGVTIRLNPAYHPGGSFHIVARNQHPDHVYIQSATLDGQPWNSFQLPHDRLIRGGTLELVLGPRPNKAWGTDLPPGALR